MIWLIWLLIFVISWFNAWAVGKSWYETKHAGGFGHLVNWCGLIMSAAGFTWCYLILLGYVGTTVPESVLMDQADVDVLIAAGGQIGPLIKSSTMTAFLNLGYLIIWFPVVGSGLVIIRDHH